MNFLLRIFSIVALLALAGCGGGGGSAGTPPFGDGGGGGGGGGTVVVADLDVSLSSQTIANSGTGSVTVTVTALDANRNAVPDAAVTLSADGGLLTVTGDAGSVTDESGALRATLTLGSDLSAPRTIVVRAANGSVARTANLSVIPATSGATPASIELIASDTRVGTGGDTITISAYVKDASNNALPATAVAFSTSTGTLTAVATSTNSAGIATAQLSAGADKTNRSAIVRVQSGTISATLNIAIDGTSITVSGPSSLVLGETGNFDVVVTDSKANPVSGIAIVATSALGNALTPLEGTTSTNARGTVRFAYAATRSGSDTITFADGATPATSTMSSTAAMTVSGEDFAFISPAPSTDVPVNVAQEVQVRLRSGGAPVAGRTIDFAATGGTLTASSAATDAGGIARVSLTSTSAGPVTVQASVRGSATTTTLPLNIIAVNPAKLVLQITPTAIAPNLLPSGTNQAQVVAKVTDATGNPVQGVSVNFTRVTDPSGGNLLQASATTDSSGQATVVYRSGSESTASNGVVLRGTVAAAPSIFGEASLTVNQQSLFIALGTGNVITNVDPQTYRSDWTVYVTDANGVAVDGATLTIKAIPSYYLTGELIWNSRQYVYATGIQACRNEDANNNGILDAGEDDNGDGVLWPGNVIAVSPSTVQTVSGRATVSLTYAESYAPWIELRLTASTTVAGTESKTDAVFIVKGASADFNQETSPPAGLASPFGAVPRGGAVCVSLP